MTSLVQPKYTRERCAQMEEDVSRGHLYTASLAKLLQFGLLAKPASLKMRTHLSSPSISTCNQDRLESTHTESPHLSVRSPPSCRDTQNISNMFLAAFGIFPAP